MENNFHSFQELFEQLGIGGSPKQIETFLRTHGPLAPGVALPDAPFWTEAQADFLQQALQSDSDWVEVVDALNEALHR
ncbi:MAG: DUF2789 family protein [Thiobacillus sp.]|nr:DUF2789 family protein [Thiobacillus sp.]